MGDLGLVSSTLTEEEDALRIIGDGDTNEDDADDWPFLFWNANARDDDVLEYDVARRMPKPMYRFDGWWQ